MGKEPMYSIFSTPSIQYAMSKPREDKTMEVYLGILSLIDRDRRRDNLAISKLLTAIGDARTGGDLESVHLSAWLCYHDRDYEHAQTLLRDSVEGNYPEALLVQVQTLRALVDMKISGPTDTTKATSDTIRPKPPDSGSIGARLALIDWYVLKDDLENAQSELKAFGTSADRLLPVRMMAAKIQLLLRNWNGVSAALDKCLTRDPQSLPAYLLNVVSALFFRGLADKDLGKQIIALLARIQKSEPRNGTLWTRYVRLFSRAMIGDPPVLEKCLSMIQEAMAFAPNNPAVLYECAEQYLHQKRFEEARSQFEKVVPHEGYSAMATLGI
ncbi:hypothetical protein RvY_12692 [Ramazzottius varieornatus]|uniref:Tetratricopeptide repeat protein 21A/21B second ARM domain-containing protein n=1 Tax=Ramazzottius varieornatus TaxID=947166 RepID=A0A1D1VKC9_RAMVA|nr:hypothetical protein RvY_12692 [Ramazzottius varieornatus]